MCACSSAHLHSKSCVLLVCKSAYPSAMCISQYTSCVLCIWLCVSVSAFHHFYIPVFRYLWIWKSICAFVCAFCMPVYLHLWLFALLPLCISDCATFDPFSEVLQFGCFSCMIVMMQIGVLPSLHSASMVFVSWMCCSFMHYVFSVVWCCIDVILPLCTSSQ